VKSVGPASEAKRKIKLLEAEVERLREQLAAFGAKGSNVMLHEVCANEDTPLPKNAVIRFAWKDGFFEVQHDKAGGVYIMWTGSERMVILPNVSNTINLTTQARR
jgi:hypothetical protein